MQVIDNEKFIKPIVITAKYRYIKLKNQLHVFLISQATERSFAKMAVKVGDYMRPKHLNGLAHYLEHLLFINTKKYPKID